MDLQAWCRLAAVRRQGCCIARDDGNSEQHQVIILVWKLGLWICCCVSSARKLESRVILHAPDGDRHTAITQSALEATGCEISVHGMQREHAHTSAIAIVGHDRYVNPFSLTTLTA
jgi:hypothetical protein